VAHDEQIDFCKKIKIKFPEYFKNKKVLDAGSLDINGNNRYLFDNCEYIGIDVGPGKNVDVVTPIHLYKSDIQYDFIVSTECFEHDMYYKESFKNILLLLKSGGMFMFTCATTGRDEHGTERTSPQNSPLTSTSTEEKWKNYYHNISEKDLRESLDLTQFSDYYIDEHHEVKSAPLRFINDLYFWGIKK
jgi:hypothetical protein